MKTKSISKKKASILNLLFNYANTIFAIINGLVLVPLYLKYFSIGTYGSFLSSGNIVAMLGLLEGGTSMVLTQRLSASFAKRDYQTFSKLIGSGLFISFCLTSALVIIGLLFFPFISGWVKAEPKEYTGIQYSFLLSAIGAGLSISFSNISAAFQAWLRVKTSGMINLISIPLGILTTLLGLKFGLGVVSIPLGILVKSLFGVISLLIVLFKTLVKERYPKISIDKTDCVNLVRTTFPVFGSMVAKSVVTNSQLLIITNVIDPVSSAVFFMTGRIFNLCESLLAPIGSSIFASISQMVAEGDGQKIKTNLIKVFVIFSGFSVLILTMSLGVNKLFVGIWVGMDKFGGEALSALLCLTMFISTRFKFLEFILFALGIFGRTVFYDLICGAIRVLLIFSLIRYLGFIAIPIAELIPTVLILGYFLNKLMISKIQLNRNESIKFVFAGGLALAIGFTVSLVGSIYYKYELKMEWLVLYVVVLFIVNSLLVILFTEEFRDLGSKLIRSKQSD